MSNLNLVNVNKPTLVIREAVCRANIARMADKAHASGVIFRPHFKTHQSIMVGRWFREAGVRAITVSSLSMAREFAADGWDDITIAFPANLRELDGYQQLATEINLHLLVDSAEVVSILAEKITTSTGIFIEVDTGYKRSGVRHSDTALIQEMTGMINKAGNLQFKGFLTHDGNTYHARDQQEIKEIYQHTTHRLNQLKQSFSAQFPGIITSIGDTPSCTIIDWLGDVDEIRPGNFVFYDLMQYFLGSCHLSDLGASVACPVTGLYPERNEIVIYGGAVHLSKEYLEEPERLYGLVCSYDEKGWSDPWPGTRLVSMSQEHGIISTNKELLTRVRHGDLLGILPVHSCLTANLLSDDIYVL